MGRQWTMLRRISLLAATLLADPMGVHALSSPDAEMTRRSALQQSLASAASAASVIAAAGSGLASGGMPMVVPAAHAESAQDSFLSAYQIFPDSTPARNPEIKSVAEDTLIKVLGQKSGALWMGEHHNAERDHVLQANLIRRLHASKRRKGQDLAIGLEQVQVQFQPVLDAYVSGKLTIDELRKGVEWDKRWIWPFEGYQGVFELAKELKIPLIALNVDSEDLSRVEEGGYANLPPDKRGKYILDPQGFANFAKPGSFKCYVEYIILPSFDMHEQLGLLKYSVSGQKLTEPMNFQRFLSGRMLWDEAMASGAYRWTKDHPGGLLVGLVGADHVKFQGGIPGRYDRMVGHQRDTVSMILNPSLIDTRPSGSVSMAENTYDPDRLTLQLIYAKEGVDTTTDERFKDENIGGTLPLADYIVTSNS